MKLNKEQLKQLQRVLLELLIEIDRICRENDIKYTLDCGTLLGAVREKGFISWDDDADIAMSREEYEKFYNVCKKKLDTSQFMLQEYRTDPEYPWGYSKFRMKGTEMIRTGQSHLKFFQGIFVDIFVYDHVPDGFFSRRIHYVKCNAIRKCQYAVVGKVNEKNPLLRGIYIILDKIPREKLFRSLRKMGEKENIKKTELSRRLTYPYFTQEAKFGLPTIFFNDYTDIIFEGHRFMVTKEYDRLLHMIYGDYMTPPKPEDLPKENVMESLKFKEKI